MDAARFDALTRAAAPGTPRRGVVAAAAATVLALLALCSQETAARRRKRHRQGKAKGVGSACTSVSCPTGLARVKGSCAPPNA